MKTLQQPVWKNLHYTEGKTNLRHPVCKKEDISKYCDNISLKNVRFFNFFPLSLKKSLPVGSKSTLVNGGPASYLLRVKSKLGSGQGLSLSVGYKSQKLRDGHI